MMKKIHNATEGTIAVVTYNGEKNIWTNIPANETSTVEIVEGATFNDGDFYVENEGKFYAKHENCYTGADVEIYTED